MKERYTGGDEVRVSIGMPHDQIHSISMEHRAKSMAKKKFSAEHRRHISEARLGRKRTREEVLAQKRAYYNRPDVRARANALRSRPEALAKKKAYEHSEEYKRYSRSEHLRKKYKITIEQYEELLKKQDGVCAICLKPETLNGKLSVDHDHRTKANRGLLCTKCNMALGLFTDSAVLLESAKKYVIKHSK